MRKLLTLMLAVWFGASLYASGNSSSLARDLRQSQVIGAFDALMPVEPFILTGQIQAMFEDTGFPTVFAGLGPEPQPASTPHEPFGLFRGMTLNEAIRQVESRYQRRAK